MPRLLPLSLLLIAGMANAACPPLLDHRFKLLDGSSLDLCKYADQPILVVNTASKCGFAPQFDALEKLYRDYKPRGLLVIGFPSNDFRQELPSNKEIGDFCRLTYFVQFPMVESSVVTGSKAIPFFRQLKAATGDVPRWNFHKYVIAPGGKTVTAFGTLTKPDAPEILDAIRPGLRPAP
ncbi:glutathione peroxidase [Microvirgula aerodenitrificans]|uniref:Glutathione peroxidase n=1 Tax=Microvirgula aerodenitrificans TaxID=57480 RepID=A0A2S0PAH5_9NEIS|nr:glutathione peroxidase [Microvirgula aerodenitrificans]AVY94313.1 glutathione peroxidase [Microvirgula aerodenitrificans]